MNTVQWLDLIRECRALHSLLIREIPSLGLHEMVRGLYTLSKGGLQRKLERSSRVTDEVFLTDMHLYAKACLASYGSALTDYVTSLGDTPKVDRIAVDGRAKNAGSRTTNRILRARRKLDSSPTLLLDSVTELQESEQPDVPESEGDTLGPYDSRPVSSPGLGRETRGRESRGRESRGRERREGGRTVAGMDYESMPETERQEAQRVMQWVGMGPEALMRWTHQVKLFTPTYVMYRYERYDQGHLVRLLE
ncbi:hypothetical protein KIPB_006421 [Kipferlia bialata]|uniref:Uncharacterized protein n=1 Tax=Kipferlia bialata TaxID=797122 RepID=A0A9K3CYZ0_9EUKA|nr:hypothetical protein KIPB_006421 [Kipferlia bialata]|eukprot:g6421.t1